MEKDAFADFVADIKINGVREPITIHKNLILDGRNRWLACQQLEIPCPQRVYEGKESDLLAFVVSRNLHRRRMSESQTAMVAGRIANMTHGGNVRAQCGAKRNTKSTTVRCGKVRHGMLARIVCHPFVGFTGFLAGPLIFGGLLLVRYRSKKFPSYELDPKGEAGRFDPLLSKYIRASEFIIGFTKCWASCIPNCTVAC